MKIKKLLRDDNSLYLTRYTLLWLPFLKIRLHHIHLSDYDCLHDHPWNFISVMLRGGYYEIREREVPEKVTAQTFLKVVAEKWIYDHKQDRFVSKNWISPGCILFRRAEDRHRLEIPAGKSAWTLVFMFKRRREWGFWRLGKFIHHNLYTSKQTCE